MKSSFIILAACLAASLALVSCEKESTTKTDNGGEAKEGVRTITVSFADVTRSELNGFQPSFKANDKIMVSNGSKSEECTVSIDKGVASITIKDSELQEAELTAVYPSDAWINSSPYFKVSTEQSGKFEDANICKATISAGSKDALFENQTAIFRITPGAGAETEYVEVITAGPEIADFAPQGSSYTTMHKIHVASETADEVFVSILVPSGLKIRDLSFADGSNMKTAKDNSTAVASNTLYTVDNKNWSEPYVEVDGLKWATRNIGASSPTEYGLYFAWGETDGHIGYTSTKKFENDYSFSWSNAPFNNGQSSYDGTYFGSVKDNVCPAGVLASSYDAANVNWGGAWRMPTQEELATLANLDNEWVDGYSDSGVSGRKFSEGADSIFLPAAGYGSSATLYSAGVGGYYWSSSLNTDDPSRAFRLYFINNNILANVSSVSFCGYSVRPLSE